MASYRLTEGDLRIYLRDNTADEQDTVAASARRADLLSDARIPKNLRKARHDFADGEWREFAIAPLEEALYWMGEVVALAFGHKITNDMRGHRYRALECLKIYVSVFMPSYAPHARVFHDIGTARNDRSYRNAPPSVEDVARWLDVGEKIWPVFRVDIARRTTGR